MSAIFSGDVRNRTIQLGSHYCTRNDRISCKKRVKKHQKSDLFAVFRSISCVFHVSDPPFFSSWRLKSPFPVPPQAAHFALDPLGQELIHLSAPGRPSAQNPRRKAARDYVIVDRTQMTLHLVQCLQIFFEAGTINIAKK